MTHRIGIVLDELFDRTVKDWAEELREETRANLDGGVWEAYGLIVVEAHCDKPHCPHDKELGSLWGIVTDSGLERSYATVASIPDAHMREVAEEIIKENE